MVDTPHYFWSNVQKKLDANGQSFAWLGRQLNLTERQIYYARGRAPSIDIAKQVAALLNVRLPTLMKEERE